MINRRGNKKNLTKYLLPLFPPHEIYIEPFFGSGSVFFAKQKVKYNYLNDLDDDVYNFYRQVIDNKDALIEALDMLPLSKRQFVEWRDGKREQSDLMNAVRFFVLSNCSLYGARDTLVFIPSNPLEHGICKINKFFDKIKGCRFANEDFRTFFSIIHLAGTSDRKRAFCYADPPYFNTANKYDTGAWGLQDFCDLLDILIDMKIRFGVSEFDTPEVIEEAKKRGLGVHYLKTRMSNVMKKRTEIYIHNYSLPMIF